jgi:PDZ domain-containing protein
MLGLYQTAPSDRNLQPTGHRHDRATKRTGQMSEQVSTAPPPPPAPPEPRRRRVWRFVGIALVVVAVVLVVAANVIRVPYVIISPGEATPLDGEVVSISGAETYPDDPGDLLFLTVRVSTDEPTVWRYLFSQLDGDVSIEKKERVLGCATFEESARLNELLMQQSQDTATAVALEKLGYQVDPGTSSVVIVDVLCDGPADDRLEQGDTITAIDGQPVTTNEQVRPLVQAHAPGDDLTVTVDRDGERQDIVVRLGSADGTALLGIATQDFVAQEFPIDVTIDTARVGGPSAGLAFTLAIIDDLTPGSLTGGERVAVTGSIQPDGAVGIVGGVAQKAVTARTNGVRLMLVPKGEAKQARERAEGMKVVAVSSIDDALAALRRAGGDPITPVGT